MIFYYLMNGKVYIHAAAITPETLPTLTLWSREAPLEVITDRHSMKENMEVTLFKLQALGREVVVRDYELITTIEDRSMLVVKDRRQLGGMGATDQFELVCALE